MSNFSLDDYFRFVSTAEYIKLSREPSVGNNLLNTQLKLVKISALLKMC